VTTLHVSPEGTTAAERIETLGRFMDLVRQVNMERTPAAV
jgi:hypothetical protein